MTDIRNNPNLPWNSNISRNPNLNIQFIREHMDEDDANKDWQEISRNPAITMTDIIDNPDLPWDYEYISDNPNLDIEFIREHINENWCWEWISANPGITMTDIKNNPDLPWDYEYISDNPNLDIEFITDSEYNNKDWYWPSISRNLFDPECISIFTSRLKFSD
jgi:hypothetical protein